MPLITACPNCDTQFVVTQEQLDAYQGKVRCGTCQHVFNAKEYIVEGEEATSTQPVTTAESKVERLLKSVSLDEQDTSVDMDIEVGEFSKSYSPELATEIATEVTAEKAEKQAEPLIEIDDKEPHIGDIAAAAEAKTPSVAQKKAASPSRVEDLTIDDRLNALSKKKKPFNWFLAFVTLLLLLALLAQALYYLRTEVMARFPQTKPWYVIACKEIGCKIELPKKLAMITIDDSDMKEHLERENVLQFSSTIINHAPYPQAYPNLVLTLTNIDDEPVLRRNLTPAQYLKEKTRIAQGINGKEEVRVKLNITTGDVAVAGYRVDRVYPK